MKNEMRKETNKNFSNVNYFEVKGLFNGRDIKIEFKKQVNIFIGTNGCGKTIALKLLYLTLTRQFDKLSRIDFEKIVINFKDNSIFEITPKKIPKLKEKSNCTITRTPDDTLISYSNEKLEKEIKENIVFIKDIRDVENVSLDNVRMEDLLKNIQKYKSDITEINNENFHSFSGGIKNLIYIFSKIYTKNRTKKIVLIDEPEQSISIIWQKTLLDDIISFGDCNAIITTTHSPFIFDNDFNFNAYELPVFIKNK